MINHCVCGRDNCNGRALAASQAEVANMQAWLDQERDTVATLREELYHWKVEFDAANSDRAMFIRDLTASRENRLGLEVERDALAGALERARWLLREAHNCKPGYCYPSICQIRAFLTPPAPIATPGTEPRALCGCTKWWDEPSLGELDRMKPATRCPACNHPGPHDKPCDYYAATPGTATEVLGVICRVCDGTKERPARIDGAAPGPGVAAEPAWDPKDHANHPARYCEICQSDAPAPAPDVPPAQPCRTCKGKHPQFCSACMGSGVASKPPPTE